MTEEAPNNLRHFLAQHRVAPRYYATGQPWNDHWELHIDGIGTTQAASGETHRDIIIDYISALGHDTDNAHIFIYYPGHPAP